MITPKQYEEHEIHMSLHCSVREVACEFGYSTGHILDLCNSGRILARKSDRVWIIYKPSMKEYLESRYKNYRKRTVFR